MSCPDMSYEAYVQLAIELDLSFRWESEDQWLSIGWSIRKAVMEKLQLKLETKLAMHEQWGTF